MISGFPDVRYQIPRPRQHIEERLTLIIDFYHLLLRLCSEALLKRTNRVSTDVADKHARYIAELLLSPAKSRGHEWSGDNSAHRCVDYQFCKRTAIISAARELRRCKRKGFDALFLCRENGGQQVMFSGIFMSYPQWDLLYLIRNKVDY